MSINTMNAVWAHSRASGRARLVLLAIADHQGEIGSWPSIKTLAKMVNASERSVQRDLKELEELGELRVEVQNAPTRQQYKSNLYWVLLPGVTNDNSGVTESDSGVTNTSSGVTESSSGVTAGGALTLNRTITKPLREPSTRLPENWQPSEASMTQMREHFPTIDFKLETHAFRDYWAAIPGSRGMKVDWDATWRNWIRNAYKRSNKSNDNNETIRRWLNESE